MTSTSFGTDGSLSSEPRPQLLDLPAGQGLSLGVRDWGGQGIPCVLLHGIGEGAFVWDDFAREICDQWRVLAIDLPGHGASSWLPSGKYSLDDHVAAVASALEVLRLEHLVLMGHSLGGDVALRLAPRFAGVLRGLVLVDTGPEADAEAPVVVATQMRESRRSYETVAEYGDWLCAQRGMVRPEILYRHAEAALRPRAQGGFELRTDPALVGMLEVESDDTWWKLALSRLREPTLLVRGIGSSVLTAPLARAMLSLLPNGSVAVVSGAGHGVMSDNPEGFLEAILPFLRTLLKPLQRSTA